MFAGVGVIGLVAGTSVAGFVAGAAGLVTPVLVAAGLVLVAGAVVVAEAEPTVATCSRSCSLQDQARRVVIEDRGDLGQRGGTGK